MGKNAFNVKNATEFSTTQWKSYISSDIQLQQKFKGHYAITFWDDLDQKRSALSRCAIRRHHSPAHISLLSYFITGSTNAFIVWKSSMTKFSRKTLLWGL
jgi:hypothetical protein